ncbi:MAG: PKD domain-containing protein [Saprospiraceae bacterium]|nr:PKD domain-containing protein [Saprospiraceae bacterium]
MVGANHLPVNFIADAGDWSTGDTTATVTGLGFGTYYFTVTDSDGFFKSDSVAILNLNKTISPPTVAAVPSSTVCTGSNVYAIAFSSEPLSPSYEWYDIFDSLIFVGDLLLLPQIAGPTQVYAITNVNNCLSTPTSISINALPSPDATFALNLNTPAILDTVVFVPNSIVPANTYDWTFGDGDTATGPNAKHVYTNEGIYVASLTVTTPQGCSATYSQAVAVNDGAIDVLLDVTPAFCDGSSTGSASAQAINGSPPYQYLWSNGATTNLVNNLQPGTYSLTVIDANGVSRVVEVVISTSANGLTPPLVLPNLGQPVCPGEGFWVVAASGNPNAQYYWFTAAVGGTLVFIGDQLFVNEAQQGLSLFVESRQGSCTSNRTPVVVPANNFDARFEASLYEAQPNQAITFSVSTPLAGYQSQWEFGNGDVGTGTSINYNYPLPGIYIVRLTVTSPQGCSVSEERLVTILSELQVILQITRPECPNLNTGMIISQVLDGTPPFSYQWSNGLTTPNLTNLAAGQYTLTVTDATGQRATVTTNLAALVYTLQPPSFSINGSQPVCKGDNVWVTAYSNQSGVEFYWYGSAGGNDLLFVGNPLVIYDIQSNKQFWVETRYAGCLTSTRLGVTVNVTAPNASFQLSTTSVAPGQLLSAFNIQVIPGYTYFWNFGNGTTATINSSNYSFSYNLPGLYEFSITVTAPNGCSDTRRQYIYVYTPVVDPPDDNGGASLSVVFDVTSAQCALQSNGSIQASVINGTPPYSYNWSNGDNTSAISGLSPGIYTLTVTDSEGQSVVASAQVFNQLGTLVPPIVTVNGGYDICQGDDIWLAAASPSGPASFYWYNESTSGQLINVGGTLFLSDVQVQDTFYVEARIDGCAVSNRSMVIVKPATLFTEFTASPQVIPEGGSILFETDTIVAGHSYNWVFGDGATAIGSQVSHTYLHQGTYEVTLIVVNQDSCTAERKLFINIYPVPNSAPVLLLNTTQNVQCPDDASGSISASVFGGTPPYSYLWSNGAVTSQLIGLLPGQYNLTVTDALGQTATGTADVLSQYPNLAAPQIVLNNNQNICLGGDAWVAANAVYPNATYYWYDALVGGNLIYVGNPLPVNNVQNDLLYFAETLIGACISSSRTPVSIDLTEVNGDFTASAIVAPIGMPILFTALENNPQATFSWDFANGSTGNIGSLSHTYDIPGLYEVSLTVNLPGGCQATSSQWIKITLGNNDLAVAIQRSDATCAGDSDGSIALTISGGTSPYDVQWGDGATGTTRTGLTTGIYSVAITDALGATLIENINVGSQTQAIDLPTVTVNGGLPLCAGEPFLAVAANNISNPEYRWYDAPVDGNLVFAGPSFPIAGLFQNDTLYVEAFYNGCFSSGRTQVNLEAENVSALFTASTTIIQLGSSVDLDPNTVSPNNTYEWDFGDGLGSTNANTSHTYNDPGIYLITLKVTGPNGCVISRSLSVEVINNQQMALSLVVTDNPCPESTEGAITAQIVNGSAPFTYNWSNGQSGSSIAGLPVGNYSVTVTDSQGATVVQQAEITNTTGLSFIAAPAVFLNGANPVCPGSSISLFAMTNQAGIPTYNWYDAPQGGNLLNIGAIYNTFGPLSNETFYVQTNYNGCLSDTRTPFNLMVDNPNLGFVASTQFLFENEEVILTPNLQNAGNIYAWTFGDGTGSSDMQPNHTYTYPDLFDVSLTVTSPNGCMVTTQEPDFINVISSTQLTLILDMEPVTCEGASDGSIQALVFNGLPPYTYQWSNGATTSSLSQLSPGNYSLTLSDSGGLMITAQTQVTTMHPLPVTPGIIWAGPSTVCAGTDVALQAGSTVPVDSFLWYNLNGDLLHVGNVLVLDDMQTAGSFYLESHANGCVSAQTSLSLGVQILDATFSLSTSQALEVGNALTLTPNVATYTSYAWNFGDGNTSQATSPVYSYSQAGQYSISLTVTDASGCTATSTITNAVQVFEPNSLAATFSVQNVLCSADQTGEATILVSGGTPPYQYDWSNGATTAQASALAEGTYSVTVTDAVNNIFTASVQIENQNATIPAPNVVVNGNLPACKGETAFILANSNAYPDADFQWYSEPAGGQPLYTGILYLLPNLQSDQTLFCEANVNGCISTRQTVSVAVQAPNALFSSNPNTVPIPEGTMVQFTPATMMPNHTYHWEFGDNGWSQTQQPYYIYNLPGNFDVSLTVTDEDGCSDTQMYPDYVIVSALSNFGPDPDDVEERERTLETQVPMFTAGAFPNPFVDDFTVVIENDTEGEFQLTLTDLAGRNVINQTITLNAGKHQLRVETGLLSLPAGVYSLVIRQGEAWGSLQMIKN